MFGSETVIHIEISLPTLRVEKFHEENNLDRLRTHLDLLKKIRERDQIRMLTYKQKVARYYNTKVKPKIFQKGDLVLHQAEVSKSMEQEKLALNWEGPYRVIEVI